MTASYYVYCGSLAFVGFLISLLLQMKAQRDKARLGNIIFHPGQFISDEWISLATSVVVIALALMLLPIAFDIKPAWIPYIRPMFVPIGYMGTDIFLKSIGKVNADLNKALGYKAQIADELTGNLQAPTPATPGRTTAPPASN